MTTTPEFVTGFDLEEPATTTTRVAKPKSDENATDLAQSCRENNELVEDLARFAEGLYTEQFVRRKYRDLLDNEAWTTLGTDDLLVEMIEAEKARRIRNGSAKRELAQKHIVRGVGVLTSIMDDPKANPKHRVDSIKSLDALADPESQRAHDDSDRYIVTINLGGDEKLVFGGPVKPNPNNNTIIDGTPQELEAIPPKRGRGRPPGSRNKPKTKEAESAPETLLPFITNQRSDGGSGEPI